MTSKFYNRVIKPRSDQPDQAEREIVLNYLLLGVLALACVALLDTMLVYAVIRGDYLLNRMASVAVAIAFIVALYVIARRKQYFKPVAAVTTWLIALAAILTAFRWGVLIPTGLLLFSLAVVMAGVLISARYSIYMALALVAVMIGLQYGQTHGQLKPDLSWVGTRPTEGDVIGFSAILLIIALVSWLFNRQMERSLQKAQRSEKALQT